MNPRKMLTVATIAGLSLGGLTATSAVAAQGYGSGDNGSSVDSIELVQLEGEIEETEESGETEREGRSDGHRGGCSFETAAEAIGIDEADLKAAVEDGATIADVAEENGVAVATVIEAMVDAKEDRIAEKVESGRITQEQADDKLAELEDKITDRVNGVDRSTSDTAA